MLIPVFLLPFWLLLTDVQVNWTTLKPGDEIKVMAPRPDKDLNRCLKGGMAIQYEYLFMICKYRPAWFDKCEQQRKLVRSLRYEPVTETYTILTVAGDGSQNMSEIVSSWSEALSLLSTADRVNLPLLTSQYKDLTRSKRAYIRVRIKASCEQYNDSDSGNRPFRFMDVEGFDTGWEDFFLGREGYHPRN